MERIEYVSNPVIGNSYLVKCIKSKRAFIIGDYVGWCPVFGELHHDKEIYLTEMHYHIDWRFVPNYYLNEQHECYQNRNWYKGQNNTYYFAPVMKNDIIEEAYLPMVYLHHFDEFPEHNFDELVELYKDVKMHNMICPHKKANLKSCKVENDVVTCPCHGLKWNVKTGCLAN